MKSCTPPPLHLYPVHPSRLIKAAQCVDTISSPLAAEHVCPYVVLQMEQQAEAFERSVNPMHEKSEGGEEKPLVPMRRNESDQDGGNRHWPHCHRCIWSSMLCSCPDGTEHS